MLSVWLLVGVVLAALFLVLDCLQTLWIARNPTLMSELNVFLGKHPSVARVYLYFALCLAIVFAVTLALYWANYVVLAIVFCFVVALFEAVVVWRNHALHIPVST